MPHAWLITGPRGIGKATLAWRAAGSCWPRPRSRRTACSARRPRPPSLDVDPDLPAARQVRARPHPGVLLVRRGWDDKTEACSRPQITVDEMRSSRASSSMSAADGGRRVVIVDDADEMNRNAANAILKVLEEPPARAVLLLVSHQPLAPAADDPLALPRAARCTARAGRPWPGAEARRGARGRRIGERPGQLAGGSVGAAMQLTQATGSRLYGRIVALMDTLPRLDRARAMRAVRSRRGPRERDALST